MKRFLILPILFLFACSEEEKPKAPDWNSKKSVELNKNLSEEEDFAIRSFLIHRKDLTIEESGTGLRFALLKKGTGPKIEVNQEAKVIYSIRLLDGTLCYQTADDEYDLFTVDHSELESGIHEGIKKMHIGDKAIMVFPSHLAHGLIGNFEKIPPLSPLHIELELIDIKK